MTPISEFIVTFLGGVLLCAIAYVLLWVFV